MARLPHGMVITQEMFLEARASLAERSGDVTLAFAAALPAELQDFDFMFPDLQNDPANLLVEDPATRDRLARLGNSMHDTSGSDPSGDAVIPAIYTYFGQFVDHDITLETVSADMPALVDNPDLAPLPSDTIRAVIRNMRTATLDLDSLYGIPAPTAGEKMQLGPVTALGGTNPPMLRPPSAQDNDHDLPRLPRASVPELDRAALIGDPRNDENTIVAQLHVAFLRAHNALVDQGKTFDEARTLLRQHYQHIVLHDFLKKIANPQIVDNIIQYGNQVYDAMAEPFFLPLEFSVAAFRFGHSMVRGAYSFNLNFNFSGQPGTFPATLQQLFTFTALSSQLGDFDTLPENWIIEWPRLIDKDENPARLIDTRLVEPLFHLTNVTGGELPGEAARLALRNLLRGYLLRMPTGQAVAQRLGLTPLTAQEIQDVAAAADAATGQTGNESQVQALKDGNFLERTPLWYYILAEAAAHAGGQHLGPVGSTIVAEVLVGLVRRSDDSILRTAGWAPTIGSQPGTFNLDDLLRLGGVL